MLVSKIKFPKKYQQRRSGSKVTIITNLINFKKIKIPSRIGICCSVAKSCPTQRSHGLKQTGLPCPLLSPRLRLLCIGSVMPSKHLILCHPFLLLASVFPSIRLFSNELALCIRQPKYWSFSISPSDGCESEGCSAMSNSL